MEGRALFSTAYLPPVAYMAAMAANDVVDIEVCETYAKQTYRNRCTILTANGPLDLTIPIVRPHGNHTATGEPLSLPTAHRHIFSTTATAWKRYYWRATNG